MNHALAKDLSRAWLFSSMNEEEYLALLDRARSLIPKDAFDRQRFEIPSAEVIFQGKTTIVKNFQKIVELFRRPVNHIKRFILGEVGTSGDVRSGMLLLKGLFKRDTINEAVRHYCDTYVLCPSCSKPDTELVKRGKQEFKVCHACGAETVPKL
ncbi:MAG: translation initiation factor IF-2 subunit beta [Promethearchaeota archaeon]